MLFRSVSQSRYPKNMRALTEEQRTRYSSAIRHGFIDPDHPVRHNFCTTWIVKNPGRTSTLVRLRDILGHNPEWEDMTDDTLSDLKSDMLEEMAPNSVRTICAELKAVLNSNKATKPIKSATFQVILRSKKVATIDVTKEVGKVVKEAIAKKEVETKKQEVANVNKINNDVLAKLFSDNGCAAHSKAKSANVVYQQFGTKSRVLMYNGKKVPNRSQLLLTEADYEEFKRWYDKQDKSIKDMFEADTVSVPGVLSESEKPRVKSVKVDVIDGLVEYIKFMAKFEVNKVGYEAPKKEKKSKKEVAVIAK